MALTGYELSVLVNMPTHGSVRLDARIAIPSMHPGAKAGSIQSMSTGTSETTIICVASNPDMIANNMSRLMYYIGYSLVCDQSHFEEAFSRSTLRTHLTPLNPLSSDFY